VGQSRVLPIGAAVNARADRHGGQAAYARPRTGRRSVAPTRTRLGGFQRCSEAEDADHQAGLIMAQDQVAGAEVKSLVSRFPWNGNSTRRLTRLNS
jgi:hypothetical protein